MTQREQLPPDLAAEFEKHRPYESTLDEAMGSCVGAAFWYARRGWRVHPLCAPVFDADGVFTGDCDEPTHHRDKFGNATTCGKNAGKRPRLLRDWPEKATTDAATIIKWWEKWPDSNVGIVPGPRSGGLVVLDVDPRKGDVAKAEALYRKKQAPLTWRVRSGSGGYHLYFDASAIVDVPATVGDLELKANDGANIVAPPSIHYSGGVYAVTWEATLAPFPREWLERTVTPVGPAPARIARDDDVARAKAALGRLDARRAEDYEQWLRVGMALHAASDALLPEWDEWSRQSPKWQEGICAEKWRGFRPKEHGLTIASVVAWAREDELRGGLVCADAVKTEPIAWLWYGRVAFGKLQGVVGLPDQGKDTVALNVAARLSRGAAMPDGRPAPDGPRPTYYLSVEDALGDTLKPRFVAAGGDARYLFTRRVVTRDGEAAQLALDEHLKVVRSDLAEVQRLRGTGPGLFVLSPFDAFFSGKVDAWKAAEIRRALAPVTALVEETGWALLAIAHLNKDPSMAAVHRIANSQAFGAALRVAYLVAEDPAEPSRRLFLPMKRNLLPPDVTGLAFRLLSVPTPDIANPGPTDTVPTAKWEGETRISAADALAGPQKLTEAEKGQAWLIEQLGVGLENGVATAELEARAAASGLAWNTVRKQLGAIGAKSERAVDPATGQLGSVVWWLDI